MAKTDRLLKLAQALMEKHRWREAVQLLKEDSALLKEDWKLLWNLGWSYFKLERMDDAGKYLKRAANLAPENHSCKFALGSVYLEKKQYKKAESLLLEALQIKESYVARISLALAYLEQGKVNEAENTHLDGIRLRPKQSKRYEAYGDFLSDVGREDEAERMNQKAQELKRIN
jgi:Tfp pilus assembly protein PilF